jgi:hypothetical protein
MRKRPGIDEDKARNRCGKGQEQMRRRPKNDVEKAKKR